jgi:hypothetical protein
MPRQRFIREVNSGTHWIGGWVGLKSWSGHGSQRKNSVVLLVIEPRSSSLYSDTADRATATVNTVKNPKLCSWNIKKLMVAHLMKKFSAFIKPDD